MNVEEAHNVLFIERLKNKSTTNEKGCFLIHTSLDKDGYHIASYRGKAVKGYRKAFIIKNGPIPKGLVLNHLCRNRKCWNPNHLEIVTTKENIQKGISHNANKTHCPQGHEYTPENTYIEPKGGNRHCKICQKLTNQKLGSYRLDWQRNNKPKVKEYNHRNYMKKKGDIL